MKRKKRTTYRAKYNQNKGYIASRRILTGNNKDEIIVLYDNRDGFLGEAFGKYVIVNETISIIGVNASTRSEGMRELKGLANGEEYSWI